MVKIAVCFWGQPRFIENPATYEGIKKNLISIPNYDVDIYMHTWFSEGGTMVGSNWSGINHAINPKTLDILFDRYRNNLKRIIWSPQPNFLNDSRFVGLRQQMQANSHVSACMLPDRNFDALCSQAVSVNTVIDLIKSVNCDQYDWIIILRHDCCILSLPDLNTIDPNNLYCALSGENYVKDDYFIFNPKLIKVFELVDALQSYTVTPAMIPNAEHIRYTQITRYINPDRIISLNDYSDPKYKVIRSYE